MNQDGKKQTDERPLDPTRDAQDILGDTSGMSGITSGNPKDISAEPSDDVNNLDMEHEPGGVQDVKSPPKGSLGVPRESYSEKVYDKKIQQGMSATYATTSNAAASDSSEEIIESPGKSQSNITQQGGQTVSNDENARKGNFSIQEGTNSDLLTKDQGEISTQVSPDEAGEQSVSGDMPTPDSDDDTLANAQSVGTQTHEDTEHPEEIDIGRDIDEAEEYNRTH